MLLDQAVEKIRKWKKWKGEFILIGFEGDRGKGTEADILGTFDSDEEVIQTLEHIVEVLKKGGK